MSTFRYPFAVNRYLLRALCPLAQTEGVSVPTFVSEALCLAHDHAPPPRPQYRASNPATYQDSKGERSTVADYQLQVLLPREVRHKIDLHCIAKGIRRSAYVDRLLETARTRWAAEHPHGVAPPRPSRREPLRLAQRLASLEASAGPLPATLALLNQRVEALEEALSKK